MIRATTTGVLRGYRSNLMKSFTSLNKSRDTVLTYRNFNSYAEDPSGAALSFQLRRSRMRVEAQYTVNNATLGKYQAGWSGLATVDELLDTKNENSVLAAAQYASNDPTGEARTALGKELSQLSETIVQVLNNKYGDNFIFAGTDGLNVPFTWNDEGKICYRGIPLDTSVPEVVTDANNANIEVDANGNINGNGGGYYLNSKSISTITKAEYDAMDPADRPSIMSTVTDPANPVPAEFTDENGNQFYYVIDDAEVTSIADYDKSVSDLEKLNYLSDEKYFVDIGLGFKENEDGQLIESSAFNASLNGINFVGYGVDENGDPNNLLSIIKRMGEICNNVQEGGRFAAGEDEEWDRLRKKFEIGSSEFKTQYTNMSAATTKLTTNKDLLEEQHLTLQTQYSELEDVDPADAISAFLWAQYSYNSALKVGNSILAQSLMDYMT